MADLRVSLKKLAQPWIYTFCRKWKCNQSTCIVLALMICALLFCTQKSQWSSEKYQMSTLCAQINNKSSKQLKYCICFILNLWSSYYTSYINSGKKQKFCDFMLWYERMNKSSWVRRCFFFHHPNLDWRSWSLVLEISVSYEIDVFCERWTHAQVTEMFMYKV